MAGAAGANACGPQTPSNACGQDMAWAKRLLQHLLQKQSLSCNIHGVRHPLSMITTFCLLDCDSAARCTSPLDRDCCMQGGDCGAGCESPLVMAGCDRFKVDITTNASWSQEVLSDNSLGQSKAREDQSQSCRRCRYEARPSNGTNAMWQSTLFDKIKRLGPTYHIKKYL